MQKGIQVRPSAKAGHQTVTFTLAIGNIRQICSLRTSFLTQNQAFSYLHKHRAEFERAARKMFANGEIENGVIHLVML
jgi:hypothetical protein